MAPRRKKTDELPSAPGYTYEELAPLVRASLDAGLSVFLHGHPGVGKSTLAAETAAAMGLPLHDIRLAQREPAEIGGVYFPDRERRTLALLPPPWVQEVCERPGLVFLDEINAGVTRLHQAAAYQIVLERRVGPFRFHPDTAVMAAGNLERDEAIVSPLSTALENRFVHFLLRVDVPTWVAWAERNGLSSVIVSYMRAHQRFGETLLYENTGYSAFPSPRSWTMAARAFDRVPRTLRRRIVTSCVGAPAAEKLFAFVRLYERTNPKGIVAKGDIPDFTGDRGVDPSYVHATVTAVASWLSEQDDVADAWLPNVVDFARAPGLDPEYAFVFLRALRARTDLTERLKALPTYRALASDLVQLQVGLYR